MNWEDKSKNYLTKAHKGWIAWTPPGEAFPITYDETHIWVTRPNGKPVKLTQSYTHDIFTANDECRQAARTKAP